MKFTKMHGIGNDYIYVNGFEETVQNPERVSEFVSDRRFGIGGDGLVLILPSDCADFRMRIFNADGSEAMMCGNATRSIGKYVYDRGLTNKTEISLETNSGIKYLQLTPGADGTIEMISVDMGKAILVPREIPVHSDLPDRFVAQPLEVNGETHTVTCVSMGNPHCVLFTEGIMDLDLEKIGPGFENHPMFPNRINTEFVEVMDRTTLNMRVWERGSGETFACGTGACATVVAAVENGFCPHDTDILVHLRGGDLLIRYASDGQVQMTGPATIVFDGEIDLTHLEKE